MRLKKLLDMYACMCVCAYVHVYKDLLKLCAENKVRLNHL